MSDISIETIPLAQASMNGSEFQPMFPQKQSAPYAKSQDAETEPRQQDKSSFEQGVALGMERAEAKFAEERNELRNLIASANALQPEASDELAMLIGKTVETLVRQIVGDFKPDAAWLEERIAEAVSIISECDAVRTVWMHPKDIALLDTETMSHNFMADKNAERGSIRIDCSQGWVESGHSLYLDELTAELGLKGGAR